MSKSKPQIQVADFAPKEVQSQFWDKRELARYLNLSIYTIDAWVSQKKIPFYKVGKKVLFRKDEILEWIKDFKVEANNSLDFESGT